MKRVEDEDRLTQFLRRVCPRLFKVGYLALTESREKLIAQVHRGSSEGSGVEYFSAARISIAVTVITVILASTFLFGGIYNLYYVSRDQVKLALIAVYTLGFALSISLISKARRADIFAASAAYAAVLVVFVSGDLGKDCNPG